MKRIDKVYEGLKKLYNGKGITTMELAEYLDLNRANVSNDLNTLWKEGKISKFDGRPVLFFPIKKTTSLDKFLRNNRSLTRAVEQAKAAILYPPKGMNTLILGETGVGKTMFANLLYKYLLEINKIEEDSLFITFNCADYANNPQLLISQLFGVKKGAYTGAHEDRIGLLEKAHRGILFLDEVHRLPPEGQEMFFTFMDTGTFRRLGETDIDRKADVLIISATTENPDSTLLRTFTRRIPMIIKLPNLEERGLDERLYLIKTFFNEESYRLGRAISLSNEVLCRFLTYPCPNNIGQLKTDIKLSCAKTYSDFLTGKKTLFIVEVNDLPIHVQEGTYTWEEKKNLLDRFIDMDRDYYTFDEKEEDFSIQEQEDVKNIYEMIDMRINELKDKGFDNEELGAVMEKDITNYFTEYFKGLDKNLKKVNLFNIISNPKILEVTDEIIKLAEKRLKIKFSQKIYLAIAFHIQASVDRVNCGREIINPQLNVIRTKYRAEFSLALDCLNLVQKKLNVEFPIDEAGFLTMFFAMDNEPKINRNNVGILVIAHGNKVASSMLEVSNQLLGSNYGKAIDIPLDISPQEALENVKEYLIKENRYKEYLFLVDMGSLATFGEKIEKNLGIQVKTIPFVSTLHIIEGIRKAMLGYKLEDLYNDLKNIAFMEKNDGVEDKRPRNKKSALITICLTGEGTAIAIKNYLNRHLNYDENNLSIIPINLVDNESISQRIAKLEKKYKVLLAVSSIDIDYENIPIFSIEDVLNSRGIDEIQKIIDLKDIYEKMIENFNIHLKNFNGEKLFIDILEAISRIEKDSGHNLENGELIGAILHIGCMIDRFKSGEKGAKYLNKEKNITENYLVYKKVKKSLYPLIKKYEINVSDDEVCYIMDFFIKY